MGMNWTELRGKSKQSCPRVSETKRNTCVCYFVLLNWYWGINERSRGFFTREPREYVPTIENHRHTTSPWPPLDNLGWSDPRHKGNLWAFLFGSRTAPICALCHQKIYTLFWKEMLIFVLWPVFGISNFGLSQTTQITRASKNWTNQGVPSRELVVNICNPKKINIKETTLFMRVCAYMTTRSWTNVWQTTFSKYTQMSVLQCGDCLNIFTCQLCGNIIRMYFNNNFTQNVREQISRCTNWLIQNDTTHVWACGSSIPPTCVFWNPDDAHCSRPSQC